MRCGCFLAAVAATGLGGFAQADMIAYWDFNALLPAPNTPHGIVADQGAGVILADGTFGSSNWISSSSNPQLTSFVGFADNALPGVAAGTSLGLSNSASGTNGVGSANGFSVVVKLDLTNWESVSLSYASRASGSGFGFSSHTWSVSTDGVNFTTVQTYTGTNASSVAVRNLGTMAALDHQANAFIRLTVDGATASNGHNRFDNVVVDGVYATPAPGAVALIGLSGLLARRRRA